MEGGKPRKALFLPLFAALQFAWILLATLGLWGNARGMFGIRIDEQVWMFGITLPLTLLSIHLAQATDWKHLPTLVAISTALHFAVYFLPLFFLMGAHMNIFALIEYGKLLAFFALLYTCAIAAGIFVFRLFNKEPAT